MRDVIQFLGVLLANFVPRLVIPGAGVALDAATRTSADGSAALTVACIERGDFASETSSRSTKLIWAGIKYLASAAAAAISLNLLTSPIKTVEDFYGEFKMVFNW